MQQHFLNKSVIHAEQDHGEAGLTNLFGAEFPDLKAGLAIAEQVSLIIEKESN
jgi:hypothetical protein